MNLPERRRARRGTLDEGGLRLNLRREFPCLARNRRGTRRWALRDCFGEAQLSTSDLAISALELQGRGAMESGRLELRCALVACHSPELGDRVRAFVERRALPAALRDKVDHVRPGRGPSDLSALRCETLVSPGFSWWEKFEGTDGIARTYSTYNAHHGLVYVCVNTTGVHGGGIVRTVAPEGHAVCVLDEMAEPDANGGEAARWYYGRIGGTRIHGWFPRRAA